MGLRWELLPADHAAQVEVTDYDLAGNEIKASQESPAGAKGRSFLM